MSDDEPTDKELYGELARRLHLAYVSCRVRLAYSTVERRFPREMPGPYWIELAKHLTEDLLDSVDDVLPPVDAPARSWGGDN
jgi:hypothetical protein